MKIENQTIIIGMIVGFTLGLFVGWSTGVSEDVILEETDVTYGEVIESIDSVDYKSIDTIDYKRIDTVVMNYDWGREEIYIYEYN